MPVDHTGGLQTPLQAGYAKGNSSLFGKAEGTTTCPPKRHKAETGGRAQLLISMKTNTKEIYKNTKKATKFTKTSRKVIFCKNVTM